MFAGKKSAQIREILISESAWEEMTCLFAPSLGLRMVAEGVEYGYQQQWLRKNNVDYLQGYQFLPPVMFDDFMRFYKQSVGLFESASDSTFSA